MTTPGEHTHHWKDIEDDFVTAAIEPLSEDPPFYGKVDDNLEELKKQSIFSNMKYTTLQRPLKLPKLHSCDRDFKSESSRDYFCKLWDGSFQIDWQERWNGKPDDGLYFCVVADDETRKLLPEGLPLHDGKYTMVISLHATNPDMQPYEGHGYAGATNLCGVLEPTASAFSWHLSQQGALVCRVLHRFFRSHAHLLSPFHFEQVYVHLENSYVKEAGFTEQVDIGMAKADTMLYANPECLYPNRVFFFHKLGEALEGKERYADAAMIYEDIGIFWDKLSNQSAVIPPTRVWGNAGLAHKRSGNYSEAERCFLRGLWVDINHHERSGQRRELSSAADWDTQEHDTSYIIQQLGHVYAAWHIVQKLLKENLVSEDQVLDMAALDERCLPILNGLAHVAGVPLLPPADVNISSSIRQIKNKFVANPGAAKKALYMAVAGSEPSVESIRSKLFAYHNTKRKKFVFVMEDPASFVSVFTRDRKDRKSLKESARELVRNYSEKYETMVPVGICNKCQKQFPRSQLKACPCKAVQYCGKECRKFDENDIPCFLTSLVRVCNITRSRSLE